MCSFYLFLKEKRSRRNRKTKKNFGDIEHFKSSFRPLSAIRSVLCQWLHAGRNISTYVERAGEQLCDRHQFSVGTDDACQQCQTYSTHLSWRLLSSRPVDVFHLDFYALGLRFGTCRCFTNLVAIWSLLFDPFHHAVECLCFGNERSDQRWWSLSHDLSRLGTGIRWLDRRSLLLCQRHGQRTKCGRFSRSSSRTVWRWKSVSSLREKCLVLARSLGRFNVFHGSRWWRFLYGSCINMLSLITCLLGSSLFTIATSFIFFLVMLMFLTLIISFFIRHPQLVMIPTFNTHVYQQQTESSNTTELIYGHYTGFSAETWHSNLYANYTVDYTTGHTTDFEKIFGILFSSITGLLAGANMSGELKQPSRSIPIGSVTALLFAFAIYILEVLLCVCLTSELFSLLLAM